MDDSPMNAEVLVPDKGVYPLKLVHVTPSIYVSKYIISHHSPQGLYGIQAWTSNERAPRAIAKATFLFRKIVGDFCMIGIFNRNDLKADIDKYIREIKGFGANFLIAHTIITHHRVYYKSKICNLDSSSAIDQSYLGTLLEYTDENGISVMLSVSWDMTRKIPPPERMENMCEIIKELYDLYGSHPSLVGFYSYQEGSGIYYAPYVRKFCRCVKRIDRGLLTACAPYMDNPLLASYLSAIKNLDIIIYQSMVMASYRPDNRLKFPYRRVKDFGSLAAGAKELQHKVILTHVETFGYLENALRNLYITSYDNIYQQILSAATVPGNDGIIMFNYSGVIYNTLRQYPQYRQEFLRSREAVFDGIKAFELIGRASSEPDRLALYVPWTDFQEFRWEQNYYSALDAFRILGIPIDILPWAPIHDGSYPPYYPQSENPRVLKRILKKKEVLVFPSISGLNETDSELIRHFLEKGGSVVAFGPMIPMGATYNRSLVFGIEKTSICRTHTDIVSYFDLSSKVTVRKKWGLGKVTLPVWRIAGADVIAKFEDGSPAITVNSYGKGKVVSILTNAMTAAERFPSLVRLLLDYIGVQRYVDILGTNSNCDVAISKANRGFVTAIVNHSRSKLEITLHPLTPCSPGETLHWSDLVARKEIARLKDGMALKIEVFPHSYRLLEMLDKSGQ